MLHLSIDCCNKAKAILLVNNFNEVKQRLGQKLHLKVRLDHSLRLTFVVFCSFHFSHTHFRRNQILQRNEREREGERERGGV
jgi:hypothetical protein